MPVSVLLQKRKRWRDNYPDDEVHRSKHQTMLRKVGVIQEITSNEIGIWFRSGSLKTRDRGPGPASLKPKKLEAHENIAYPASSYTIDIGATPEKQKQLMMQ